jgi:hypothetical protein
MSYQEKLAAAIGFAARGNFKEARAVLDTLDIEELKTALRILQDVGHLADGALLRKLSERPEDPPVPGPEPPPLDHV